MDEYLPHTSSTLIALGDEVLLHHSLFEEAQDLAISRAKVHDRFERMRLKARLADSIIAPAIMPDSQPAEPRQAAFPPS